MIRPLASLQAARRALCTAVPSFSGATSAELAGTQGRYRGKTVIVTGGAKGIGEGCVRVFHEAGANVVFGDVDVDVGEALATELNENAAYSSSNNAIAQFQPCDVRHEAQLEALVGAAFAIEGRLDCVINNAGWHPPPTSIDDFSVADFTDLLALNLVSTFTLSKLALPQLRKTQGNIINVRSS